MNKSIVLVFLFVILCVGFCSADYVTARSVGYTQNNATTTFTFEAAAAALDTNQPLGVVDLVAFLAQKNVLLYQHYAAIADFTNIGNITDAIAADFAFLLKFYALIEYQEVNGISGFQRVGWNADNGTSDIILSAYYNETVGPSVQWYIKLDTQDAIQGAAITKLYTLTIGTTDGVFNYTVTYAGKVFETKQATIDANSFKLEFNINYYNYSGASNNTQSQVALVLLAGSSKAVAKSVAYNGTDVSGIKVASGSYSGYINFENNADTWDVTGVYNRSHITFGYVDNYQAAVGVVDWTAAALFLSYDAIRPNSISYDPEIGADLPPVISNSTNPGTTTGVSSTGSQVNPSSTTGSVSGSSTGSQVNPSSTTGSVSGSSTSNVGGTTTSQTNPSSTTGSVSGSSTGSQVNPSSTTGSVSGSSTGSQVNPSSTTGSVSGTTGSQTNPSSTTGSVSGSSTGSQVNPSSTTGSPLTPNLGSFNTPNVALVGLVLLVMLIF